MLAIAFAYVRTLDAPDRVSIGGTLVPAGLDCAEDEVIAFSGPDRLTCVHHENIN